MRLPASIRLGSPVDALPADQALGPGLLETMRCQQGRVPLWQQHRQRLARGGADTATLDAIQAFLERTLGGLDAPARARLRLLPAAGEPYWDLALTPLDVAASQALLRDGVRLFSCATRLDIDEVGNSGCKQLRRRLYNLASAELPDAGLEVDGLLQDASGRLIETTRCNLLLFTGERWLTPDLARCGVRGVMRDWLGDRIGLGEVEMNTGLLDSALEGRAGELAVCNGVRGVVPVASLDGRDLGPAGPETRRLQQLIAEELW